MFNFYEIEKRQGDILSFKHFCLFLIFLTVVFFYLNEKKEERLINDLNKFSGISKKEFKIIEIPDLRPAIGFELNGTFYIGDQSHAMNSYAVITDKAQKYSKQELYQIGDLIRGYKIIAIFKGSVILSKLGTKTALKLKIHDKFLDSLTN